MTSNMSIYYIIGTNPNEYFDIFRIGSYFTISNASVLNSISNLFYDKNNFHIFAFGRKKDYMLSQQTNNKFYYQLGNTNNDFYEISSDQFIHFHLFSNIRRLFSVLIKKIKNDTSDKILIIMQDHGGLYCFKEYSYVFFLDNLSTITSEKDIFIYDESCYSGSLVELFEKNNDIFKYYQQKSKISDPEISSLFFFSVLQNFMYCDFGKCFTIFLRDASCFISNIDQDSFDFFFSSEFKNLNNEILKSIALKYTKERTKDFFQISIEQLNENLPFTPKITKLNKLISHNVKFLAHLYIINYIDKIIQIYPQTSTFNLKQYFNNDNYETFKEINEQVFNISMDQEINEQVFNISMDQEINDRKSAKMKQLLYYMWSFYKEYFNTNLKFFNFKSQIEIVSSTGLNQLSSCYTTIHVNRITKIFPNSPSFAFFIRNAFFNYNQYFNFVDFYKSIHSDSKEILYYPIFSYKKHSNTYSLINQNPKRSIYSKNDYQFTFTPSNSLFGKIAAVRFITKFVRDYFSKFQNMEFPTLDFSCFFSRIPSDLLINFISLSILPNPDVFSKAKLNNENFLNILKFSNLTFSSTENKFRFITLFSTILSSEIKFLIAKNLITIIKNHSQKKINNSIYLFSANEFQYTQDFIKSSDLNISDNSNKSIQLFLTNLFSENYIDIYNSITPEKYEKTEGLNKLKNLEKSSEFNLQKMFLDLESSILNIIPSDVFIFFAIYSNLIFMNRSQIFENTNSKIQVDEMLKKLFQIFDIDSLNKNAKQKIDSFNNLSLMNILRFCNQYISIRLQETFNFLEFFFQTYYFVSFFKLHNEYIEIPNNLKIFISNLEQTSIDFSDAHSVEKLSNKLKPFPLFCLPFILCLPNLNANSFDELLSNSPQVDDLSITSILLESSDFYSKQFRIHLSNLSLYAKLKKYVLENIDLLNKISKDSSNDISNLPSLEFFKDNSPQYFTFDFGFEEEEEDEQYLKNSKQAIEFFVVETNKNCMSLHKEFINSISMYINQFKNEISGFLKPRDSEEIDEYNFFQDKLHLLLYHEKNHPYVQIVKNNFMNLNKSLSISENFKDNSNVKELLLMIIDNLAFSILEARFNNKVEIEPIVRLIPSYEGKFNNYEYWCNPTNREFMALCSAIPFTLSPKDQFRKKVILKAKMLSGKEEEEEDDDYSSQNSESNSPLKSGDYRTVFKNNEDDDYEELDKFEINCEESNKFGNQYEKSIKEALNLSTSIKMSLQTKYCASSKNWTKIIWDIFIDLFNTKLKEIDLKFDFNDKQLIKSWYLLDVENYAISKYFYALYNIPDFDEKESLIYSFMSFHSKDESKIKSAYVYAFIASYIVLKDLTSFGHP